MKQQKKITMSNYTPSLGTRNFTKSVQLLYVGKVNGKNFCENTSQNK